MRMTRITLCTAFLILAGCDTIGSLSYTSESGQTVSVGFRQRQTAQSDGKSIRGFAK